MYYGFNGQVSGFMLTDETKGIEYPTEWFHFIAEGERYPKDVPAAEAWRLALIAQEKLIAGVSA